jgi:hypothetical protein
MVVVQWLGRIRRVLLESILTGIKTLRRHSFFVIPLGKGTDSNEHLRGVT